MSRPKVGAPTYPAVFIFLREGGKPRKDSDLEGGGGGPYGGIPDRMGKMSLEGRLRVPACRAPPELLRGTWFMGGKFTKTWDSKVYPVICEP